MAALRLIDALPDFAAPGREARAPVFVASPHPQAAPSLAAPLLAEPPPAAPPPPELPDIAEIVRMEVAVAEEALRIRLEAEHGKALEAERDAHCEALAAQAERFGREAGDLIAGRLDELERAVAGQLGGEVARILGGMLSEDLRKRSIDSLAAKIGEALRDAEAIRIEVRGPQSMFAGLAAVLGARVVNLDFIETNGLDLSATIDGSVFETRLSQWAEELSGIFA